MNEQICLFEMLNEDRARSAAPLFGAGQLVYILSLDVVLNGAIGNSWICGKDDKDPYFGYSVDLTAGGHTVVWDYEIGSTVFNNLADAEREAKKASTKVVKITPAEIVAHDVRGFEYSRTHDGYGLKAIIAKVGEKQLYEEAFMCYHFLRTYAKTEERDKAYKAGLCKMLEEVERGNGRETTEVQFIELYRVADTLFASREYAKQNGAEYLTLKKPACEVAI